MTWPSFPGARRSRLAAIHLALAACVWHSPTLSAQPSLIQPASYVLRLSQNSPVDVSTLPAVLRQPVTVHLRDVTVGDALKEIGRQASISFAYSDAVLAGAARTTLDVDDVSVAEALQLTLAGRGVEVWMSTSRRLAIVPETVNATSTVVGVVAGLVFDAVTQRPLSGARVVVTGTTRLAVADEAGRFRLPEVDGEQVTLSATAIGYRPTTVSARVGDLNVRIAMSGSVVDLDRVVVTGTAGNQARRAQSAVVATVDASSIAQVAPVANVHQLLSGRTAGVSIQQASGSVGGVSYIRMRGISSLTLSSDPLVFVDGVRMENRNVAVRGTAVSTLNDLDPSTIESIEVVKGPAAATLYGADASAGVIQIITKKGRAGQTNFSQSITLETGVLQRNWTPPDNFGTCAASDVAPTSLSTLCRGQAVGTIVSDNPFLRESYLRDGRSNILNWQGRGGSPSLAYFFGFGHTDQTGVLPTNSLQQNNVRANFSILPRSDLTIDASLGANRSVNYQTAVGDATYSPMYAVIGGSPLTVGGPVNGWWAGNQNSTALKNVSNGLTIVRFQPAIITRYQPFGWFTNRLTLGGDIPRLHQRQLLPKNDQGWYGNPNDLGFVSESWTSSDTWTVDYLADAKRDFGGGKWEGGLSLGAQIVDNTTSTVGGSGTGLATNSSNTLASTATNTSTSSRVASRSLGYLGQLQLAYRQKLFLQYGARFDRSSAFGSEVPLFYLPKYGVSYVVSDEPVWREHLPWINTMRLRAAYGTTGRSPAPGASLARYSGASFVATNGTVVSGVVLSNPGNAQLRPEKGTELEGGFEVAALDDRVGIDVTYYNKVTRDLLIAKPIPASVGYLSDPLVNLGQVVNRGVELTLRGTMLSSRRVALSSQASLTTLHNELHSLGGLPAFSTGIASINQYREGYPLGAYFSPRVKSVDPTRGVAIVSDTLEYGGNPIPTYQGTFSSDLTVFGTLRLNGLLEFKGGNTLYDISDAFRDLSRGISESYNKRFTLPVEERLRNFGPFVNSRGQTVGAAQVVDSYLRDASFVRLRELSASWSLPARFAARVKASSGAIVVGGRNLALWTNYSDIWDPETIGGGYLPTSGVAFVVDVATLPRPRELFTRLNLAF